MEEKFRNEQKEEMAEEAPVAGPSNGSGEQRQEEFGQEIRAIIENTWTEITKMAERMTFGKWSDFEGTQMCREHFIPKAEILLRVLKERLRGHGLEIAGDRDWLMMAIQRNLREFEKCRGEWICEHYKTFRRIGMVEFCVSVEAKLRRIEVEIVQAPVAGPPGGNREEVEVPGEELAQPDGANRGNQLSLNQQIRVQEWLEALPERWMPDLERVDGDYFEQMNRDAEESVTMETNQKTMMDGSLI